MNHEQMRQAQEEWKDFWGGSTTYNDVNMAIDMIGTNKWTRLCGIYLEAEAKAKADSATSMGDKWKIHKYARDKVNKTMYRAEGETMSTGGMMHLLGIISWCSKTKWLFPKTE